MNQSIFCFCFLGHELKKIIITNVVCTQHTNKGGIWISLFTLARWNSSVVRRKTNTKREATGGLAFKKERKKRIRPYDLSRFCCLGFRYIPSPRCRTVGHLCYRQVGLRPAHITNPPLFFLNCRPNKTGRNCSLSFHPLRDKTKIIIKNNLTMYT